jgi:hypothetical protein
MSTSVSPDSSSIRIRRNCYRASIQISFGAGSGRGKRDLKRDKLFKFSRSNKFTDNLPFFSGNPGTKMGALRKDQFENPESRVATIQQNKVKMVEMFKMAGGHLSLGVRIFEAICVPEKK